jgi:hypothetical protein
MIRARFEQESLQREEYLKKNFPVYAVNGRSVTIGDNLAGQPVEEIALQLRGSLHAVTHYLEEFERNSQLSWNWAAFLGGLFGPFWFFFRKLYKAGLLFGAIWLIATLAFLPTRRSLQAAYERTAAPSYNQLLQAVKDGDAAKALAAQDEFLLACQKLLWQHRLALSLKAAQILLLAVAEGLVANSLLRRRVWNNIAKANEEAEGQQGYARHQLLIRLGGTSAFIPMLWFWASSFLPQLILTVIESITS